ncbi:MAG: tyrosine-type recombinase/integrase [Nannocystales bacterium]
MHLHPFKARRRNEGVSNKTINEELAILSKLLSYAHEIGDREGTPPNIRRLKTQRPSFDFFDFEEAERLLTAARAAPDPWSAMIPTAVFTGLRLGELRGLLWSDVDLAGAQLHVRRAADDAGKLGPPKSGRARVVDLPRRAVEVLRAHRHIRGAFVFCREDGSMLQRWHCESKSKLERGDSPLMKRCWEAGLRRMGWHGLRHTYASHLMMRGASVTQVKELLGHSSISMTMRYAHLSPNARRSAAALLDEPAPQYMSSTRQDQERENGS